MKTDKILKLIKLLYNSLNIFFRKWVWSICTTYLYCSWYSATEFEMAYFYVVDIIQLKNSKWRSFSLPVSR